MFLGFLFSIQADEASLVMKINAARAANDCKCVVDAMREGRSSELVVVKWIEAMALMCDQRDDRAEAHRVMFSQTLGGIALLLE